MVLKYHYNTIIGTGGLLNNQLKRVTENQDDVNRFIDDIENHHKDYEYDEIGQLIKDKHDKSYENLNEKKK